MPTRITNFLHDSKVAPGSPPTLGTSFATDDVHLHDMTGDLPSFKGAGLYQGIVDLIHVTLTSAGTPSTVTIRLCLDANGDQTIVPDTTATLVAGITTAATKCAAFAVDQTIFQQNAGDNRNLYLFAKVDSGTAVFAESVITWRE